jgi:hypothetical protein
MQNSQEADDINCKPSISSHRSDRVEASGTTHSVLYTFEDKEIP